MKISSEAEYIAANERVQEILRQDSDSLTQEERKELIELTSAIFEYTRTHLPRLPA